MSIVERLQVRFAKRDFIHLIIIIFFKPTSIHSAKCPVIAMILRDTSMKIAG